MEWRRSENPLRKVCVMNITKKDAAIKVGIDRADHNQPTGHVSDNAEIQRAAEAARTQRLEEIRIAKTKSSS